MNKVGVPLTPLRMPLWKIFKDPACVASAKGAQHLLPIEAQLFTVGYETLVVERIVVFIEGIVHGPEESADSRLLGDLGGMHSVGMHLTQREVAEGEAQVIAHRTLDRLDDRVELATGRAFAEFAKGGRFAVE
jgi:hypothetical protein